MFFSSSHHLPLYPHLVALVIATNGATLTAATDVHLRCRHRCFRTRSFRHTVPCRGIRCGSRRSRACADIPHCSHRWHIHMLCVRPDCSSLRRRVINREKCFPNIEPLIPKSSSSSFKPQKRARSRNEANQMCVRINFPLFSTLSHGRSSAVGAVCVDSLPSTHAIMMSALLHAPSAPEGHALLMQDEAYLAARLRVPQALSECALPAETASAGGKPSPANSRGHFLVCRRAECDRCAARDVSSRLRGDPEGA